MDDSPHLLPVQSLHAMIAFDITDMLERNVKKGSVRACCPIMELRV